MAPGKRERFSCPFLALVERTFGSYGILKIELWEELVLRNQYKHGLLDSLEASCPFLGRYDHEGRVGGVRSILHRSCIDGHFGSPFEFFCSHWKDPADERNGNL